MKTERIQSKAETWAWRSFAVVSVLALGWFVFIYGEGSGTVIVEKMMGYQPDPKILEENKKRDAKIELDREEAKALQAEAEAWDRINKSMRSARTEKERAAVQSEAARLRALSAESARVRKAARENLAAGKD